MQNKILKTLYNKEWYTTSNVLHKDFNILQIEDILNISAGICSQSATRKFARKLLSLFYNER